nr:hypothetical protein CFP56_12387 [Quercus suber]
MSRQLLPQALDLVRNPAHSGAVAGLCFLADCVLTAGVLWKIPCTYLVAAPTFHTLHCIHSQSHRSYRGKKRMIHMSKLLHSPTAVLSSLLVQTTVADSSIHIQTPRLTGVPTCSRSRSSSQASATTCASSVTPGRWSIPPRTFGSIAPYVPARRRATVCVPIAGAEQAAAFGVCAAPVQRLFRGVVSGGRGGVLAAAPMGSGQRGIQSRGWCEDGAVAGTASSWRGVMASSGQRQSVEFGGDHGAGADHACVSVSCDVSPQLCGSCVRVHAPVLVQVDGELAVRRGGSLSLARILFRIAGGPYRVTGVLRRDSMAAPVPSLPPEGHPADPPAPASGRPGPDLTTCDARFRADQHPHRYHRRLLVCEKLTLPVLRVHCLVHAVSAVAQRTTSGPHLRRLGGTGMGVERVPELRHLLDGGRGLFSLHGRQHMGRH